MKRKILLTLITLAAANAYASPIVEPKVLNSREWTEGNIKVEWKKGHTRPKNLLNMQKQTENPFEKCTVVSRVDFESVISPTGYIFSDIDVNIFNSTANSKRHTLTTSVCVFQIFDAETSHETMREVGCAYRNDTIDSLPRRHASYPIDLALTAAFDKPGKYHIGIQVSAQEPNSDMAYTSTNWKIVDTEAPQKS